LEQKLELFSRCFSKVASELQIGNHLSTNSETKVESLINNSRKRKKVIQIKFWNRNNIQTTKTQEMKFRKLKKRLVDKKRNNISKILRFFMGSASEIFRSLLFGKWWDEALLWKGGLRPSTLPSFYFGFLNCFQSLRLYFFFYKCLSLYR
jgi:hypothetical protein